MNWTRVHSFDWTLVASVVAFFLIASCNHDERLLPSKVDDFPSAHSPTECASRAGTWREGPPGRSGFCVIPTTDGGKSCTDHAECQSVCVAADDLRHAVQTSGTCKVDYALYFTCINFVEDGTVDYVCID